MRKERVDILKQRLDTLKATKEAPLDADIPMSTGSKYYTQSRELMDDIGAESKKLDELADSVKPELRESAEKAYKKLIQLQKGHTDEYSDDSYDNGNYDLDY